MTWIKRVCILKPGLVVTNHTHPYSSLLGRGEVSWLSLFGTEIKKTASTIIIGSAIKIHSQLKKKSPEVMYH